VLVADGNFGMGQLVVGKPGEPTDVVLLDIADNGHRDTGREALYLYGAGTNAGLVIHPGSRLVLNDLNVYAMIGGVYQQLVPGPFGGGTIELRRDPAALGDVFPRQPKSPWVIRDDSADGINDADIDLEFEAVAGNSPHPRFDLDGVAGLSSADVDHLVLNILDTHYGDANLDGQVDITDLGLLATNWQDCGLGWAYGNFDGDLFIDITDLGILATNWQAGVGSGRMSFTDALAQVGLPASVPEPAGITALGAAMLAATSVRTRRRP
jgi:hypothetical protein